MKKIIIASKNPVKLNACLNGFQKVFPNEKFVIEAISVPSGVSDQPKNNKETYLGASNRVNNASKDIVDADYFVGIEGGIQENDLGMEAFAWIIVKNKNGIIGKSRTSTFFLPSKVARLIKQGKELGEADDIVFNRINSKQATGAIGILTNNLIDRTKCYTEAIILALIPFINDSLYNV